MNYGKAFWIGCGSAGSRNAHLFTSIIPDLGPKAIGLVNVRKSQERAALRPTVALFGPLTIGEEE